jgi:hypothetical protein
MFDVFYRGLSPKEKKQFCEKSDISYMTVRNAYLPKDPLKRRAPRPETMLRMIAASEGKLNLLLLLDYFYVSVMFELMKLEQFEDAKRHVRMFESSKRSISILDTE